MNDEVMALYRQAGVEPGQRLPADAAADAGLLRFLPVAHLGGRAAPGAVDLVDPRPVHARPLLRPAPPDGCDQRASCRGCRRRRPIPMQAKLLQILPVVFTIFAFAFPSGLVVYWVTNNLLTMAQQALILKGKNTPRAECRLNHFHHGTRVWRSSHAATVLLREFGRSGGDDGRPPFRNRARAALLQGPRQEDRLPQRPPPGGDRGRSGHPVAQRRRDPGARQGGGQTGRGAAAADERAPVERPAPVITTTTTPGRSVPREAPRRDEWPRRSAAPRPRRRSSAGHADDEEEDGQQAFGLGVGASAERAPARPVGRPRRSSRPPRQDARPEGGPRVRTPAARRTTAAASRSKGPRRTAAARTPRRHGTAGNGAACRQRRESGQPRAAGATAAAVVASDRGGRGGQDRGGRAAGGRTATAVAAIGGVEPAPDRRGRPPSEGRWRAGRKGGRGEERPRREMVKVVEHTWKDGEWRELLSEEGDNVSREVLAFEKAIELILDVMDLDIEFSVSEGEIYLVEFSGEDRERLVAEEGRALKAIEHILPRIVRGMVGEALPCRVDCEDFQASRELELVELAKKTAEEVGRSMKPRLLPPMSPADRRIIHVTLMEDPDVDTMSEGDGFIKRIKIFPVRH